MRLRTFTASSMQAAMAQVRAALGDEAIILSTSTAKNGAVTLTAAIDESPSPHGEEGRGGGVSANSAVVGRRAPSPAFLPMGGGDNNGWLDDLAFHLRWHNIPEPLAGRMLYKARHLDLSALFALHNLNGEDRALLESKALGKLLAALFLFSPLPLHDARLKLMLTGPPGIGKTLAVAKLAAQWVMDRSAVTVITTDTKRAGGIEQLSAFTDILGVKLHVAENPAALKALIESAPGRALIDTAGCNPYDKADLAELTDLIALGGFEPVLTLPAGMDSMEAADAARAFAYPAITRLLITRADTARRFGSLLAAADVRPLAFCNISTSSRVVGELNPLDSAGLAQLMLQSRREG